ncbi:MAG: hypothetical protein VKP70_12530 [Cyanobacteriota bacterium]|nr:hypothetical protein [Cyanobacteriota bacterium]
MEMLSCPAGAAARVFSPEVVRVPVKVILYRQAMAENGQGDRPLPLGPALPFDHVWYQQ